MTQNFPDGLTRWPGTSDVLCAVLRDLPDYISAQRWYPGKNAGRASVELKALMPLESKATTAALAVWRACVPGVVETDFFLPLAACAPAEVAPGTPPITTLADGRLIVDALSVDAFVHELLAMMAAGRTTQDGRLEAGHTLALVQKDSFSTHPLHRSRVEQSNTSIRVGDRAMLKAIRKLLPGVNPELEMGRFLTERAHFEPIASLWGWIQFSGCTIAVLQAFVPNHGDGWTWVLGQLQQRTDTAAMHSWIRQLGRATAQLHRALAAPSTDPAFGAEPARPEDWRRWTAALQDMADRVLRTVGREGNLNALAREFATHRTTLDTACRTLLAKAPAVLLTRHHGDFHLGQVLVSGDGGVTIVDFEGEPSRGLAERRARHVPLRDVAGMLRSFGYAAAMAQAAGDAPAGADGEVRDPYLKTWLEEATANFVEAYFATLAIAGSDRGDALELIRFFSIEKALYEVSYELANRPQWASIPLQQLLLLLKSREGQ